MNFFAAGLVTLTCNYLHCTYSGTAHFLYLLCRPGWYLTTAGYVFARDLHDWEEEEEEDEEEEEEEEEEEKSAHLSHPHLWINFCTFSSSSSPSLRSPRRGCPSALALLTTSSRVS